MIYDCFMYFNERSMLEFRVAELNPYVDVFVVVESNLTFTGEPKPFYFDEIPPGTFDQYGDKMVRIKVNFPRPNMTPWERESFQRNCLVPPDVGPDDIVIMSDVDEIPAPWSIIWFAQDTEATPKQLDVDQFFWTFNWKVPAHCNQGARPVISYGRHIISPQAMRADTNMERVPNAGWHMSFFMDKDTGDASKKIKAYSHTEMDQEQYTDPEAVAKRINFGIDPFDRFPLKYTEIGDNHPKYFRDNQHKYGKWVTNNPWKT